jgi:aldehyde dehydrogenase (NAD+)
VSTTEAESQVVARGEPRLLIGGELVEAASGKRFENRNPATEEVIGEVADGGVDDMQRAITAARRAFDETDWSTNRALRKRCLLQLTEAMLADRAAFAAEMVAEGGCPVGTLLPQLDVPLESALQWPAEMIDRFDWERELPINTAYGMRSWRRVVKEPVGVVGAITPWNYPMQVVLSKLGPALAVGCTVVLKPAPDTPWSATRIGRLAAEHTDLPPGVLNVVTSADHLVGEALSLDPRVDMISFTGSTATGRRIMEKSAPSVRRLNLELGGKSAHLVLDDADFSRLAYVAFSVCSHAGQACANLTRLVVPRSRYDEAIDAVAPGFGMVKYGDPTNPENIMGPVVSKKQHERVLGYIEQGVAEGARLVTGGHRPAHLERGYYVEPTLFADVDNSMTIAREEIFGPVLVVIPHDGDDDAIRIANDSEYGLAGAVTSASEERALAVARRMRTGNIAINGGIASAPDAPFGGWKASGIGVKYGIEGLEEHVLTKTLAGPAPNESTRPPTNEER